MIGGASPSSEAQISPTCTVDASLEMGLMEITASISEYFTTKHCKKIEERDTFLFTILFNQKKNIIQHYFCHFCVKT